MPSLLERRSDLQNAPQRVLLSIQDINDNNPIVSPVVVRRNIRGPPTVSGFAPLPPITASPVCTPTASIATASSAPLASPLSNTPLESSSSSQSTSSYLTPPTTPSDNSHQPPVPTWVAVPPTPSTQLLFKSLTSTRKSRPHIPPSASSPVAHFSRHARPSFHRRASFPTAYRPTDFADSAVETTPSSQPMSVSPSGDTARQRSPRRLFHVVDEASSDAEDDSTPFTDSPRYEGAYISLGSSEEQAVTRHKDRIRRFHALLELLTTEMAYLTDLRTLVKVYLRSLSTWPCKGFGAFSRSSSFTSASRANSMSHLHSSNVAPLTPIDAKISPTKEKDRRFMFSPSDIDALSRNIEDILQLHERFVDELHALMAVFDFPIPSSDTEAEQFRRDPDPWLSKVDDATRAVSSKFATEASRFNSYQTFCAGHSEALTLVHKAQHQYTTDWAAFQQYCSAELLAGDDSSESPPGPQQIDDSLVSERNPNGSRSRTVSCSSTDSIVYIVRRKTHASSADSTPEPAAKIKSSRLTFIDYLIKPVQRICKYPLLLDQLRSRGVEDKLADDINVVVSSASQAMRHVASSVDEARYRQDRAIQTSFIALRLSAALSLANAYYSSSRQSIDVLTPSFLSSLGPCLLAGSLDVLHSKGAAVPKVAKYHAAFLYSGGYLILAKIKSKAHYEPRHWFPLSLVSVADVEAGAIFPHSFRLSSLEHQFELAASCQREKAIWLTALSESLNADPTWINEPTPSLHLNTKGDTTVPPLPSNNRMAESMVVESTHRSALHDGPQRSVVSEDGHANTSPSSFRVEVNTRPPARRSSTTSIKARFSNSPSSSPTMTISRSSPAARYIVDNALQDVISESCSTARALASNREEDLFPVGGLSRSKTASSAMNRLSKHENVRVPRRGSFIEAIDPPTTLRPIQLRTPTFVGSQPNSATTPSPRDSVPPLTDSTRSATPSSVASVPAMVLGTRQTTQPRRTTRSMVGDLRELFGPRFASSSRSSLVEGVRTDETVTKTSSFTIFRKWTRNARHRRTHSAPGQPEQDDKAIPVLPNLDFGLGLSVSPPKVS